MNPARDIALIDRLLARPAQTAWLEFKRGNADPEMMGKRCSALVNSARIEGLDLASLMRRMTMCEQQGCGLDKVVQTCEVLRLPAPLFRADGIATQAVLYGPRSFAEKTQDERVQACYFHAVLKFLSGGKMKKAGLRARLGIAAKNAAQALAVIGKTLDAGLIRVADPEHPRAAYLPHWA